MFVILLSPGAGETAAEVVFHPSVLLVLVLKFDQKLFFLIFFNLRVMFLRLDCDSVDILSQAHCKISRLFFDQRKLFSSLDLSGLVTSGVPQPLGTTSWSLGFTSALQTAQVTRCISSAHCWTDGGPRGGSSTRDPTACSEHAAPFWILDSLNIVINTYRHNILIYSHIHIQYAHYQIESCAEHRDIHLWSVTDSSVNFTQFIRQIRFKSPVNYFFTGLTKCLRMQNNTAKIIFHFGILVFFPRSLLNDAMLQNANANKRMRACGAAQGGASVPSVTHSPSV